MNAQKTIPEIELHLVLEALRLRHGYDFTQYSRASLQRRLTLLAETRGFDSLLQLLPGILHDDACLDRVIDHVAISITGMFRDPAMYLALRDQVLPYLATYPRIQIWLAGCATGEEACSLAILLKEEGLLAHATVYATDINPAALAMAESGRYPLKKIAQFSRNHQLSGGRGLLLDHFHVEGEQARIHEEIRERIVFSGHNLVSDGVFAETHLIYCANVLIYFNHHLRNRVLNLFRESLVHGGFLCLGNQESLLGTSVEKLFREIDPDSRIYRMRTLRPPVLPFLDEADQEQS
ncbi:MAG: protein-glutamate O-methyltransferase CheR [Magnetococcales bacterium]|nr:protein-glutamate O-methyltransferase CheR [Magnetococcales bacterium]